MNISANEAKNAYQRKWNAEHKDRVKEYQRKYWEKKAAEKNGQDQSKGEEA